MGSLDRLKGGALRALLAVGAAGGSAMVPAVLAGAAEVALPKFEKVIKMVQDEGYNMTN